MIKKILIALIFQVLILGMDVSLRTSSPSSTQMESTCPYFYGRERQFADASYGISVNGSLMMVEKAVVTRYFNPCYISIGSQNIWVSIPQHQSVISDLKAMFVHLSDKQDLDYNAYIIMNGSRWGVPYGMDQLSKYGIKSGFIVEGTADFVKQYPAGPIFLNP